MPAQVVAVHRCAGHRFSRDTVAAIELVALPEGTRLRLGRHGLVEITGLRNPCAQIEQFRTGLLAAVLGRDADGGVIRRSGVMGIVLEGSTVAAGDAILVEHRPQVHRPLRPV
jgi:MOSC domain-containing protein YiiM